MNRVHNVVCSSGWWARRAEHELVPFGIDGVELGDDVLEIGPVGLGLLTSTAAMGSVYQEVGTFQPVSLQAVVAYSTARLPSRTLSSGHVARSQARSL